jgi:hypothetical protein
VVRSENLNRRSIQNRNIAGRPDRSIEVPKNSRAIMYVSLEVRESVENAAFLDVPFLDRSCMLKPKLAEAPPQGDTPGAAVKTAKSVAGTQEFGVTPQE